MALPSSDPVADDVLAGQILDSKYELIRRLGQGGMGAVYRARRKHIGDEVAIKVLLDKFVAGNEATERFRREARAAAMLRHPNVVAIHDFSDGAGTSSPAYIVMELVEGRSLRDLLDQEGRICGGAPGHTDARSLQWSQRRSSQGRGPSRSKTR